MLHTLNAKFFTHTNVHYYGDVVATTYSMDGKQLFLMSEKGEVNGIVGVSSNKSTDDKVCPITLLPSKETTETSNITTKPSCEIKDRIQQKKRTEQKAQIIFPQNKIPFKIALTNPTDFHQQFNIYEKENDREESQLNEINVIPPHTTVEIKSHYAKKNSELWFECQTDSSGSKFVSLKDEMKNSGDKKVGSYIRISICPSKKSGQNFSNFYWKTGSYFVIFERKDKVEKEKQSTFRNPPSRYNDLDSFNQPTYGLLKDSDSSYDPNYDPFNQPVYGLLKDSVPHYDSSYDSFNQPVWRSIEVPVKKRIIHSKVGKISSNGKHIQISSCQSFEDFPINNASISCTLGLSLLENIQIKPCDKIEILKGSTRIIEQYLEGKLCDLTANFKSFIADKCLLCHSKAPNQIIFGCGHVCVDECAIQLNSKQKLSCEYCHQSVSAFLPY